MTKSLAETFQRLDNIRAGDTPVAKLVWEILAADPRSAGELYLVLTDVGEATMTAPWTVYYWLRGRHAPPRAKCNALLSYARRVGLDGVADAAEAALALNMPAADAGPVEESVA